MADSAGCRGAHMAEDDKKKAQDEEFTEAENLFKEGLSKIFQATRKVSQRVADGFREGYAKDVTKKEE
jgi:hypothetical protein